MEKREIFVIDWNRGVQWEHISLNYEGKLILIFQSWKITRNENRKQKYMHSKI